MEGRGEVGEVLDSGGSAGHEMVPVCHCYLGISQSKEDFSEPDLLRILACLTHDLVKDNSQLECLVGSSALVREL